VIEPIGDRILVAPEPEQETIRGGIVIPTTSQEKPQIGVILEMGPDVNKQPSIASSAEWSQQQAGAKKGQLVIGQRIIYGKFSGTEITVEGEPYLILRAEDVLAIVHPPAEQ
jgi:chaperonin GroES